MVAVDEILHQYGGDPASLLKFDADGPALLPYATLTAARTEGDSDLAALTGVYEWHERPLFFLVDGSRLRQDDGQLSRIRRVLAMRGDAPYLAVANPGRLTVYHVALDAVADQAKVPLDDFGVDPRIVIPHLGNVRPRSSGNQRWISDVILRLLTSALDDLSRLGVADGDAISLVGRALFVRFLADREILPDGVVGFAQEGAAALFDTVDTAAATSTWLDETFNGDFLPLATATIESLPADAFIVLGQILRRAQGAHPSFPIVVECKIIDHDSGKSVDLYCENGIRRFVAGEYAWANREALMIAYIRDGSSVDAHLAPFLERAMSLPIDPWSTSTLPTSSSRLRSAASISNHSRTFAYSAAAGAGAPGEIALWHLWLSSQR